MILNHEITTKLEAVAKAHRAFVQALRADNQDKEAREQEECFTEYALGAYGLFFCCDCGDACDPTEVRELGGDKVCPSCHYDSSHNGSFEYSRPVELFTTRK